MKSAGSKGITEISHTTQSEKIYDAFWLNVSNGVADLLINKSVGKKNKNINFVEFDEELEVLKTLELCYGSWYCFEIFIYFVKRGEEL